MVDSYEVTYFKSLVQRKADTIDPNVINDEMIREYIKKYNLENKIFGQDNMPLSELLELRLSFMNIMKIQNLRGLTKLKKLCLDNNIIVKIEGLGEELVYLEWLDLSFNNIPVVEGLDNLESLTDLSLFSNKIKVLEGGLDKCEKLNLISLGDNLLADKEGTISYLKKFQHLEVVKLEGNPMCQDNEAYRLYVIAHLSHLKYLDYILIDEADKVKAREEHRDEINKDATDKGGEEELKKREEDEKHAELEDAGLGPTYNVLPNLLEEYKDDYRKIRLLPDVQFADEDFQTKFRDATSAFQVKIMKLNAYRLEMISKFKQSVKKAEDENEQEDIKNISNYEKIEKISLRTFEQSDQDDLAEDALKEIYPKINDLEHVLIDKEMQLVERINEAIDRFEKSLKACVDQIRDETKSYQEDMNKEIDSFFTEVEKVKEEQLKQFFSETSNADNYTQEQREVYTDKEGLNSSVTLLGEEMKNLIFQIEEDVNKYYEEEMETFTVTFKEEKHERNRNHIREIMELVEEKRQRIQSTLDNA
jgi:hypothetical protein